MLISVPNQYQSTMALSSGVALAQGAKPMVTLQMPALPDPARVTLAPATTGVLLLDYVDLSASPSPNA